MEHTQKDQTTENNPLTNSLIALHMATSDADANFPVAVKINGEVSSGVKLTGDDKLQSLRRGGDGSIIELNGGWLSIDVDQANKLRPNGDSVSLYVRAWVGTEGTGTLFFSDFIALTIHPSGLAIAFQGVKTPGGKVFRELPLAYITRGIWVDLVVRVGNGTLNFFENGVLICSIPLNQSLCSPFNSVIKIGAFYWPRDWREKPGFVDGKIDTVALWDTALSDTQVAFLSGVQQISTNPHNTPFTIAIQEYNEFFDASIKKDVARCQTLWKSLRKLADEDDRRPIYHLTQPLGHIYDPAGAYYHNGKYHVFSYRNIFALLNYCSLDHYVSEDLIHWSQWPVGVWADCDLDVFGIYLMNHFVDDNGITNVLITANGIDGGQHGVLAKSRDGLVSYEEKKVIFKDYHHDGHTWKEGDTWYTITSKLYRGKRPGQLGDAVMLWSSPDLVQWEELGEIFTQPKNAEGYYDASGFMEYPYLLSFGDKDVLMLGGRPDRYWVGRFDKQQLKFIADSPRGLLLDYTNPVHCFNPLCVDQKGSGGSSRRIIQAMYSYISGGNFCALPWNGVHCLPRVLSLDGDHLRQDPVPELQKLRGRHYSQKDVMIRPSEIGHIHHRGNCIEIVAEFTPGNATCFGVTVLVSDDHKRYVRIFFDTASGEYGVDGSVPKPRCDLNGIPVQGRGPTFITKGAPVRMHVFVDKTFIETFVNGQTCSTAATIESPTDIGIDLFSVGGIALCKQLDIWEMKRAEPL